jgi:hypothetical protein
MSHVRLRPVGEEDLTVLEALTQDPEIAGEFSWFGWYNLRRFRTGWAENRLLGPDGGFLVAVDGEQTLGFVNWRRRDMTPATYCWSMGIALFLQVRGRASRVAAEAMTDPEPNSGQATTQEAGAASWAEGCTDMPSLPYPGS